MGKRSPSPPPPPDPKETAAAQTGTNISTALANAQLGNMNRFGPDGSVTHGTDGGSTITDPTTGQSYFVPQYTQTTTLSPEQQAIKDQSDAADLNLATLANNQSGFLQDYMATPVNLDNEATEGRLFELGRKRLDPVVAQRDEDLRTRLAAQGIKAGSEAYDREIRNFQQGTNDAYNQLLLQGRGQAVQEALTERNQPINEITALLSQSQVSMPQFAAPTNQPQVPTVDYAGLVNQNYQQQLANYNMQNQNRQNMLGGLFGLGASAIKAFSDKRVKRDVKKVGSLKGHSLYEYKYKGPLDDGQTHIGVMAQEAERTRPDAVTEVGGVKAVDYGSLFGASA